MDLTEVGKRLNISGFVATLKWTYLITTEIEAVKSFKLQSV
jgi:hypothetical protein